MRDLRRITGILILLPIAGTLGFMIIEGWAPLDALYMAMITITTVGYAEVRELSSAGRIFVIFYLVAGLGIFFYGIVALGEQVIRAEIQSNLEKRKMDTHIKSMSNHFIVCGAGRMGRAVCQHLAAEGLPFVVIDSNDELIDDFRAQGWHTIDGDATDDEVLINAGIQRAAALATVLSSDADNLYVSLSARTIAPELRIIARAVDESSAPKMRKAGADRVITLFGTSAMRMAQLMANPNLEDFFEVVSGPNAELDLAEIQVAADGPLVGKTLAEANLRERGVIVVGVRAASGELVFPPTADYHISPSDCLIALGSKATLSQASDLGTCSSAQAPPAANSRA